MTAPRWLALGRFLVLINLAALVAVPSGRADDTSAKAVEDRLRQDITFLASPECEGRGPATKGIDLAADYIVNEFKKAGLKPGGKDGSFFQPFTIAGAALESCGPMVLHGPKGQTIELTKGDHFYPLGLSSSGQVAGGAIVFAGYGITSKDPPYDDYKDLDVTGKVVVVLRDAPRSVNQQVASGNWRRRYGALNEKIANAERHKAAAVIFVNNWDIAQTGDDLMNFGFSATTPGRGTLPVFHMSRSVLEEILRPSSTRSLRELEEDNDRESMSLARELDGWTVNLDLKVRRGSDVIPVKNVVGVLEGRGKLANETVIIGAHYDHVGYGGQGSRSGSGRMAIHHGADDNASGTTILIELARRFGQMPGREGRRLVFIAFSAEELGLLGSVYYCKDPLYPLGDTVAMVNLDMVGRLRPDPETKKDMMLVYGTGSAKTFDALIDTLGNKYDFKLKKVASGTGPSDHASFYAKLIPVFHFFTDYHPDYHAPADTADRINVVGMRRITELVEELTAHLAAVPERPEYVRVAGGNRGGAPAASQEAPRLGIVPDYGDDKEGVRLNGVSDGMPAAKAGLKEGDRIVQINGKEVKNLENYMVLMSNQKRGDTLELSIIREGKPMAIKLKLE